MIDTESHRISQGLTRSHKSCFKYGVPLEKGPAPFLLRTYEGFKDRGGMYESGIRNGGGRILLLSTCNTVRSIDFVTFQSHLKFGSDDSISENQFNL